MQWDDGFKCIYSFQWAFLECQELLSWQNVMGKLVVKTKELLIRDLPSPVLVAVPESRPCSGPRNMTRSGPDDKPSCRVWEESCCHRPSHRVCVDGPLYLPSAKGSLHRTCNSSAQSSLTQLPNGTEAKSTPQPTARPPLWQGWFLLLHTLKSHWNYTVNNEQLKAPMETTKTPPLNAQVLLCVELCIHPPIHMLKSQPHCASECVLI